MLAMILAAIFQILLSVSKVINLQNTIFRDCSGARAGSIIVLLVNESILERTFFTENANLIGLNLDMILQAALAIYF